MDKMVALLITIIAVVGIGFVVIFGSDGLNNSISTTNASVTGNLESLDSTIITAP
ncbi:MULTISPECIES: hypothetical protein [unclassified Planococcus (in: firmicutes)]|uniref:hypothetical protein n=1 Tax=Planococcus TaxID=1372 RepID=UPI0012FF039E|nr:MULTISPECIES: hypothetical protein [unclassified Planococcus (in: firmicutes)]